MAMGHLNEFPEQDGEDGQNIGVNIKDNEENLNSQTKISFNSDLDVTMSYPLPNDVIN